MFVSKDDLDRAIKAFEKINDNGKRYASKQGHKDYKIEQIGRLEREACATTSIILWYVCYRSQIDFASRDRHDRKPVSSTTPDPQSGSKNLQ